MKFLFQLSLALSCLLQFMPSASKVCAADNWINTITTVRLPNTLLNGATGFEPRTQLPLIALLGSKEVIEKFNLTAPQKGLIEEQHRLINGLIEDVASFPHSHEMSHGLKRGLEESDREIRAALDERQLILLDAQQDYHRFRQGVIFSEADIGRLKTWLRKDQFWQQIEEPSRKSRQRAIEKVLSALDAKQVETLKKMLNEEMFFGVRTRNDVLFLQLTQNPISVASDKRDSSTFRDLSWLGAYELKPDCSVVFRSFGGQDKSVPTAAKLRLLGLPKFQARLGITSDQAAAIREYAKELNKIQLEVATEQMSKLGDLELVSADEYMKASSVENSTRFLEAESKVIMELDSLLSAEQKSSITSQLAAELVSLLGIRWSLTHGTLGKRLEVTAEQKKKSKITLNWLR